ncbi:unnamed protein product [Linum trigynum]|uniref:Uncharacterized protein n=1 Tax=Linum trigynum TaxID=586398 RepID=A0AAV2FXY1_9ROSI
MRRPQMEASKEVAWLQGSLDDECLKCQAECEARWEEERKGYVEELTLDSEKEALSKEVGAQAIEIDLLVVPSPTPQF